MVDSVTRADRANDNCNVLVTVAMPVYNAGPYLRLAVLSIVKQSFIQWELLIIDDGSTDDALDSIADINDPRIRIFRDGHNRGLAARLNEACKLANGPYFARMDQDDVSYAARLQRQVEVLDANPTIDVVATRAVTINENNTITGLFPYTLTHEQICTAPWRGFVFPHPTWMGRREWFLRHRYAEPAPYLCEDQELLLRTYAQSSFLTIDEILFAYRIKSTASRTKLAQTRRAVLAMQSRFFWQSGKLGQLTLAGAAYVVKSGVDLARRSGLRRPESYLIGEVVVASWGSTLTRLQGE